MLKFNFSFLDKMYFSSFKVILKQFSDIFFSFDLQFLALVSEFAKPKIYESLPSVLFTYLYMARMI